MWKCPVCEKTCPEMVCPNCGFDGSRDYTHYPTLAPLPKNLESMKKHRALNKDKLPKKKKKGRLILTIFFVVLVLFIWANGSLGSGNYSPVPSYTNSSAVTYQVGVVIYSFSDPFMASYASEMEAYFQSLETDTVKYNVTFFDSLADPFLQESHITKLINQQQKDIIILNPVDPSSVDPMINQAIAADIPLVLINREPLGQQGAESHKGILNNSKICYVGCRQLDAGEAQGEIIANLPDRGDINGDGIVKFVMIQGDPENADSEARVSGAINALSNAGIDYQELTRLTGHWDQTQGYAVTNTTFGRYGKSIDVIFCGNDSMALGSAAAIEAAGRKVGRDIYLVGIDATDECVEMVRNGKMTGTVGSDYAAQARKAVDVACMLLRGEDVENYYWVDFAKVS